MRRALQIAAGGTGALALLFLLGPRAEVPEAWSPPDLDLGPDPEAYLDHVEAAVPGLDPDERKEIVWADPASRARTPLALVYLHGFSADRHELDPVPREVAVRLGANLFYTRLTGHGRDGAAMGEATAGAWFADVAEAVEVGRRIGELVVLFGTSTGGTLAVWAAAEPSLGEGVAGLVLVSPNFHPRDRSSRLLLWPWGGLLARLAVGRERCFEPEDAAQAEHWTECYPSSALLPMMALVEHVRTLPLERVGAPTLILYSPGDRVVDPAETEAAFARLGARAKELVRVEGVADPQRHLLAGDIMSPATNERVIQEIVRFLRERVAPPREDA